jgi:predicted DNA-binding protein
MKRPRIEVRANPELLKKLKELAEASKRSESEYVRLIIEYAHERKIKV